VQIWKNRRARPMGVRRTGTPPLVKIPIWAAAGRTVLLDTVIRFLTILILIFIILTI
jgi:hypothetical protein